MKFKSAQTLLKVANLIDASFVGDSDFRMKIAVSIYASLKTSKGSMIIDSICFESINDLKPLYLGPPNHAEGTI